MQKGGAEFGRLPFAHGPSSRRWLLSSLALAFGFQGLVANVDLDLLGLGFGLFCQHDLQHTLVIVSADVFGINRAGQRERPSEASVQSFHAAEVLLFLFFLELALAVDGE